MASAAALAFGILTKGNQQIQHCGLRGSRVDPADIQRSFGYVVIVISFIHGRPPLEPVIF